MCTTYQSPILEVTRKNFFAKLVIPITLPCDTVLVHCQLSLVAGKSVCIVKQTPSNKATRDNGLSIWGGIFGLTLRCFTCFTPFFQLLIISALNISEQKAMLNNQYMNIYLYSNHVSTYWRKQLMKLKIVIGKRVKRLQLLYYVPMSIISENHNSVCFTIFQYDSHHPRPTFFFPYTGLCREVDACPVPEDQGNWWPDDRGAGDRSNSEWQPLMVLKNNGHYSQ